MQVIQMVYNIMAQGWDILFNDFVLFQNLSGSDVTFGAVCLVGVLIFFVLSRLTGA